MYANRMLIMLPNDACRSRAAKGRGRAFTVPVRACYRAKFGELNGSYVGKQML